MFFWTSLLGSAKKAEACSWPVAAHSAAAVAHAHHQHQWQPQCRAAAAPNSVGPPCVAQQQQPAVAVAAGGRRRPPLVVVLPKQQFVAAAAVVGVQPRWLPTHLCPTNLAYLMDGNWEVFPPNMYLRKSRRKARDWGWKNEEEKSIKIGS